MWIAAPDLVGALLGIAVFVYVLAFPLALNPADEAVFLYGAKRILHGQALYRDIFEFITPASFYLFALVFAVGGTSLLAARVAMAAIIALTSVLLYGLTRKFAGPVEALLAALVFALVCYPVWNVASAHWLSTCLCLATAAALFRERPQAAVPATPALAGALAGLTFCTQQTQGAVLAVWLGVAGVALACHGASGERLRRAMGLLTRAAAGWAAVVLVVLGYSVWRSSLAEMVYAVFTFVLDRYRPAFGGRVAWGGSPWLAKGLLPYTWPALAQAVPPILAVEAVALLWTLRHRRGRAELMRGCLLLFTVLMAISILYFPDFIHVSFIMPFPLIVAARLVGAARSSHRGQGRIVSALFALALAVAFLAVLHKGSQTLALARREAPERYATAFGTIAGTEEARKTAADIRAAMAEVGEGRVFFSYPCEAVFYLTVPAENPTPFSCMLPQYNTPEQFRTVFDALERTPAAYVVVNQFFIRPNDPVIGFLQGRYQREASVGPRGTYTLYARTAPHQGPTK